MIFLNETGQSTSEAKSVLTWTDVIKLCVPFLFSLFLLWLKEWYTSYRERRAKEEYLWRTITQDAGQFTLAMEEMNRIARAAKERKLRVVEFDVSSTMRDFANRMSELDTNNAYVYAGYSSQAEIVSKGIQALKELVQKSITAEEIDRTNLALAIEAQAESVRVDLATLAQREIDILNTIRRGNKRNKKFDEQQIQTYSNEIKKVK